MDKNNNNMKTLENIKQRILNAETTEKMLKLKGYKSILAKNGKEAIELFEKHSEIPLILMDIQMPEMNGYEATKKIRKLKNGKNVKIIALTAFALEGDMERVLEKGLNDYIAKPVRLNKMIETIEKYMK